MAEADLSVLPEGCISNILSFASPQEACTWSLISPTFKSAADSDSVWEKFLPNDYKDIVARAVPALDLSGYGSKKELYLRLCDDPLLIDGGNMSLSLEKKSGKKCFMIGARELCVHWGETPQYWEWISLDESRFAEVAHLLFVCWLYISGTIDTRTLSPKTAYVAYLVIKFTDDAHGLGFPVTEVSVDFASKEGSASGTQAAYLDPEVSGTQTAYLDPEVNQQRPNSERRSRRRNRYFLNPRLSSDPTGHFPQRRRDGWMEVEMGEFYNDDGEDGAVTMTLSETKNLNSKGGLIVQGIEVRPKGS